MADVEEILEALEGAEGLDECDIPGDVLQTVQELILGCEKFVGDKLSRLKKNWQ